MPVMEMNNDHNHNQVDRLPNDAIVAELQVEGDCDAAHAGERLLLQHHLLGPSGQSLLARISVCSNSRCTA